ncbi:Tryptophan/tyrosine permease [Parasponia andersonii]|uniref:Tryptophan/tyrosine permease n=1 Tax=Parasponia andersonii TaxID=3476 RepID=A0A2P5AC32_PARAD|nr:Tryptophan/tyrosine permease [Parasponia andersonii]
MNSHFLTSSSASLQPNWQRYASITKPTLVHRRSTRNSIKFRSIKYQSSYCLHQQQKNKLLVTKAPTKKAKSGEVADEKKGTIAGAVALIIGTSIGSGILALPQKASQAGLVPSSVSILVCWAFLLIEALLLVEINVGLRRKKGLKEEEKASELEVISLRTMAQETLGDWAGTLATLTYVFLGYTSMIAYSSKSGEILFHLINLPTPISGFLFTMLFTMLISIGGTRATDQVNQLLTVFMIGLLVVIEVLAVAFGGWLGLGGSGDWGKVPAALPVIIFSLVYHDLTPVLCAYLGSDLARVRISVFLGSLVPLITLLVWDAITLSASTDQIVDPVELLTSVRWSGVSYMVEAFSLLAIGTSLIGTLLGFSEFFKEQLAKIFWNSASTPMLQRRNMLSGVKKWWGKHTIGFTAMTMVIAPTLFVSSTVPDAFSAATDIAGGYCMTMLYGVLPPAMAWAMHNREQEKSERKALTKARPLLIGVGLFACGIVAEQILQDILILYS